MNVVPKTLVGAQIAGAALGTGLAVAGSKAYTKVTGNPAGMITSPAHIMTNNKLDDKLATAGEMAKETVKDTLKLGATTLGAATVGSLAVGNSNKVATAFKGLISKTGEALSKVSVNGQDLKALIKDTNVFKKFNSLPVAAKAGILAGAAALAIAAPFVQLYNATKMGYIEGKHEVQ